MFESRDMLERRIAECTSTLQGRLFGPLGSPQRQGIIPWVRLPEFQRESLRKIAMQVRLCR